MRVLFSFPALASLLWCRGTLLLGAASSLLLLACGPDDQTVRIEGELNGIDQAVIMAYSDDALDTDQGDFDSIKVNRGTFSYERHIEAPQLLTLVYPNYSTTTLIAQPGATIQLKGEANRLKAVEVSGTPDNDLLTDFRKRSQRIASSNASMEAASFIRANAKSMAAIALFREYFDMVEQRSKQPHLGLLDVLLKAQPNNLLLRNIDRRLRPQLLTSLGGTLPPFQAKSLKGDSISWSKLKGKATLLLFCASWDSGYYALRHQLHRLRTAYGKRLNLLLLSFEPSLADCRELAKRDTLRNVIYAEGNLSSPLALQLGVRYVPGGILLDEKGTVVARDVDVDAWYDEVKKLLK